MQKILAIFYTAMILFQSFNMSFEDVSKLSTLFEHASFHKQNYGDSFLDFIAEHYGSSNFEHGNDHQDHENLPFKYNHQTCTHINTAFTLNASNFCLDYPPFIEIPLNFIYKESNSLFEKPSVFQPPRLA